MGIKEIELKKGVKLHTISTNKFKTNIIAVFLTTTLSRENVTKDALISSILRRGSKSMPTQEQISKELEEMYGADFNCGLDKTGDNHVLRFYIETINDNFILQENENLLKTSFEKLMDIVFNPLEENGEFKKEYVEQEKNNIRRIIEGKIDNKAKYAQDRCIEEMYKNQNFGLYRYGYVEDLDSIDSKELYEYYKKLISEAKIDIYFSGMVEENIEDMVKQNECIQNLQDREPVYVPTRIVSRQMDNKENVVTESMEVTQGKLILGLDINIDDEDLKYDVLVYNSLLGGSANSKLFQNVREKAHLAYVASSSYLRHKNNIFINCGIEIANYDKALEIIKKQIEDLKNGDYKDEELENAKNGIIATVKMIEDEQDTQITYYFGQELSNSKCSIEEYMKRIENVTREKVDYIANRISINTIYFL